MKMEIKACNKRQPLPSYKRKLSKIINTTDYPAVIINAGDCSPDTDQFFP